MSVAQSKTWPHGAMRLVLLIAACVLVAGCSSKEERAKSYYENGMKLLAAHDNAKASVEFKNAVKYKKDYVAAWLALAKVEELNKNFLGQIPYLRMVVELDPKDLDDRLKLARLLLAAGSADDEPLNLVNEANVLDNHNANAIALKAVILLRNKDTGAALKEAKEALDLDPKNAAALSVLAADKWTNGDTRAALDLLDQAETDTDGKDIGIELFKLKIFGQTKDWSQAEALLKKLIDKFPEDNFRNQLIELYLFEKRPDDAEKELRAAIAAKPNDTAAELALVRLLNTFKGPAVARQELVARIDTGKDIFPYQIALAQFDFLQGHFSDSEQLLKTLIAKSSPENTRTAEINLAQMYLSRKDLDAAEALVTQILSKDERNTDGLRLRASIHIERGQLEPAINDLREALNDQPRSTELMLLLATAYERSGSIDLADREFADALRASNFNPAVGLAYVAFLQRRGSNSRAEDVLGDLASRWPQNKDVLSKLADLKLSHQDYAGAQAIAETIKNLGDVGVADQILGTSLVAQNKYSEGIATLQSAAAAAPSAVQPMLNLVRAYMRAKQNDKAAALLQTILKANPANAEAYVLLGTIQSENNQPAQAAASFQAAIAKQPKDVVGYQALVRLYTSQNDPAKAQDVINAGLKELPDNTVMHLLSANMLELKHDYEGAIAEYEATLTKDSGSLVIINNLASLLADHRTDKASLERAKTLSAMLRKSPVPQFKDTLGWIDYQNGDYKEAVPLLEQAAAALPERALIHYHLGMAYIAVNELPKASEQFKTALKQVASDEELKGKIQAGLKKTET